MIRRRQIPFTFQGTGTTLRCIIYISLALLILNHGEWNLSTGGSLIVPWVTASQSAPTKIFTYCQQRTWSLNNNNKSKTTSLSIPSSCLSLSTTTPYNEAAVLARTTSASSTSWAISPTVPLRIRQSLNALTISLPSTFFNQYISRRGSNLVNLQESERSYKYNTQKLSTSAILSKRDTFLPLTRKITKQLSVPTPERATRVGPLYIIKTGLAGGIAGAVGTITLYPFDAAKTLRQANPGKFTSVFAALRHLLLVDQDRFHYHIAAGKILGNFRFWNFGRVYKGLWASALGAIPSSALYFGAYETSKTTIRNRIHANAKEWTNDESFQQRLLIHGCAAAVGNIVSSAIFVPKELIKSKMQYLGTQSFVRTIQLILAENGIPGLYCGYKAVLMRNIPTAALRFCLYEEFRRILMDNNDTPESASIISWKLFVAGACAGAVASGLMTPVDVIKTRLSTGFCSIDAGLLGCANTVLLDSGWKGLYAGAGSRIFFSAAFSGIGFGTFEATKKVMGISTNNFSQKDSCAADDTSSTKKLPLVVSQSTSRADNIHRN